MNNMENQLDRMVIAILKSPKYKDICEDLIRNIASRELSKRRNLREAIIATKNKLHQVAGAYLRSRCDYARWLDELSAAAKSGDKERFLKVCIKIMGYHSSTRERLKILDQFYSITLSDLPPIYTVLDIACGFNPLSIPWMPLGQNVEYHAYDIYKDMMGFIREFMVIANVRGNAHVCDVILSPPTRKADLALVLKTLPCIEQVDKSASLRLLELINADYIIVSYPIQSLGGKDKKMLCNYEARFYELIREKAWSVRRFEFATELAFLVAK